MSQVAEKNRETPIYPAANEPADPHVEIIRVEHVRQPGEKWTLLDNWFASPTLIWRERMPRWMLPTVSLATKRELLDWQ